MFNLSEFFGSDATVRGLTIGGTANPAGMNSTITHTKGSTTVQTEGQHFQASMEKVHLKGSHLPPEYPQPTEPPPPYFDKEEKKPPLPSAKNAAQLPAPIPAKEKIAPVASNTEKPKLNSTIPLPSASNDDRPAAPKTEHNDNMTSPSKPQTNLNILFIANINNRPVGLEVVSGPIGGPAIPDYEEENEAHGNSSPSPRLS